MEKTKPESMTSKSEFPAALKPCIQFWVSVEGDDGNPGSISAPFATLQRARDAIRQISNTDGLPPGGVVAWIRGGRHLIADTLVLEGQDSGTADAPIVYAAYPGETPTLSGGRRVTGWQRQDDGRWTAGIPIVKTRPWRFRDLFRDDTRLPRSRCPASDDWATCENMFTVSGVSDDLKTVEFDRDLPQGDFRSQNTELVVLQNWSITRARVASIEGRRAHLATPAGVYDLPACCAQPGRRAFFEHAAAFVSEPGEWYLDGASGVLTLQAPDGVDPNEEDIRAPVLTQLLRLEGRQGQPVRNVFFHGLRFECTGWELPDIGYCGVQAGHYGPRKEEPDKPAELGYASPVAVELHHAIDCGFSFCRFAHTGASGVGLGAGSRSNRITGCEFFDIGGNAVMVGYRRAPSQDPFPLDKDWDDLADVPVCNEVSNNHIHNCGAVLFGAVGVFEAFAQETRIAHNLLTDLPYSAISAGFRWGFEPTSQKGTLIEYNHIHDVCRQLADAAGIYTLGFQNGGVLRGNLVHDIEYRGGHGVVTGLGFDAGSSDMLVERNIFYDCDWPSKGHTMGRYNWANPWESGWQEQRKDYWEKAKMTWKDNSLVSRPGDQDFPSEWAERAGPEADFQAVFPMGPAPEEPPSKS